MLKTITTCALGIMLIASSARADDKPAQLTDRQKIVHVLNRLGFGARPGDVERVEKIGLDAYIRQQLAPEKIDDAAAVKAVEHLDTLSMSSKHLNEAYFADIRRFLNSQAAQDN